MLKAGFNPAIFKQFNFKTMPLTSRIIANVYGKNGAQLDRQGGTVNGRINYFPNSGTQFYTAPSGTSFGGVTCNSIIEVFPTGLQTGPNVYACVETIAQLVANGS